MRWLCGTANDPLEMTLWVIFCRAISRNARLLYPTKLPRRPFAIEAVTGLSGLMHRNKIDEI
jgi:hypothetical protein